MTNDKRQQTQRIKIKNSLDNGIEKKMIKNAVLTSSKIF
jgi:hypothetical protein